MRNDTPVILSVFGIDPKSVSCTVELIHEISLQLGEQGWKSVICYAQPPVDEVRRHLALPNVTLEVMAQPWIAGRQQAITFWRLLRRYRPRIVHLHFTGFVNPYYWMARLNGVQSIFFTDHSSRPEGHVPRRAPLWKRCAVRIINAPLDRVFSISNFSYRSIVTLDIFPKERFQIMYNGTPLISRPIPGEEEQRQFRLQYGIPEGRSIVMQVSWVIPEKGVQDLVEAARLVLAERPGTHFVVAGDGAFREQYTKWVAELGIGGHFTFTGTIAGAGALAPAYASAAVVCQLSRWQEGFGVTIIEAMSCGRPIVATRMGGIPEVVAENETGFLVPPASPAIVAAKLLELLNDPALAEKLGQAGRRRVEEKFSLTLNVAECLDAYGIAQSVKPDLRASL
jgi:glycosyltransferase involved in cell wall biosynthesis